MTISAASYLDPEAVSMSVVRLVTGRIWFVYHEEGKWEWRGAYYPAGRPTIHNTHIPRSARGVLPTSHHTQCPIIFSLGCRPTGPVQPTAKRERTRPRL